MLSEYGAIEFTHTKRRMPEIIQRPLIVKGRPLRIASRQTADRDLVQVGRNVGMVDQDEI